MQKIRTATFEDLDAIAAVEAACFPAAEAATKEEFAGRLTHYADHFGCCSRTKSSSPLWTAL